MILALKLETPASGAARCARHQQARVHVVEDGIFRPRSGLPPEMGMKDYRVLGLGQWLALLPGCGEFPSRIPLWSGGTVLSALRYRGLGNC